MILSYFYDPKIENVTGGYSVKIYEHFFRKTTYMVTLFDQNYDTLMIRANSLITYLNGVSKGMGFINIFSNRVFLKYV